MGGDWKLCGSCVHWTCPAHFEPEERARAGIWGECSLAASKVIDGRNTTAMVVLVDDRPGSQPLLESISAVLETYQLHSCPMWEEAGQ